MMFVEFSDILIFPFDADAEALKQLCNIIGFLSVCLRAKACLISV